jgi:hypothetical protein
MQRNAVTHRTFSIVVCVVDSAFSLRGNAQANGPKRHWLWRTIDATGDVLDILVQTRRNAKAAKRFFQRLGAQFGEPRVVFTDKLHSYIKPIKTLAPDADALLALIAGAT